MTNSDEASIENTLWPHCPSISCPKPLANGITFESAEGGDAQSAQQAFETARSAIKKCGARGFNLPKNEFSVWRTLIFTFNPAEIRLL